MSNNSSVGSACGDACVEKLSILANRAVTIENIPITVIMILWMISGDVGNILVILIYTKRRIQTTAVMFITQLAIVDLVACLVIHPYVIAKQFNYYQMDNVAICKVFEFIIHTNLAISCFMLVSIAVDRFQAICYPLSFIHYREHIKSIQWFIVLFGAVTSIPIFIMYGKRTITVHVGEHIIPTTTCDFNDQYNNTRSHGIFAMCTLSTFIVVTVSITLLYIRVAFEAYRRTRTVAPYGTSVDVNSCKTQESQCLNICSATEQGRSSGSTIGQGHSSASTIVQGHSSGSTIEQGHSSGSTIVQCHSSGSTIGQGHSRGSTIGQGHSGGSTIGQCHPDGSTIELGQARESTIEQGHPQGSTIELGHAWGSKIEQGHTCGSKIEQGHTRSSPCTEAIHAVPVVRKTVTKGDHSKRDYVKVTNHGAYVPENNRTPSIDHRVRVKEYPAALDNHISNSLMTIGKSVGQLNTSPMTAIKEPKHKPHLRKSKVSPPEQSLKSNIKAAKILFLVTAVFVGSWLPFWIVKSLSASDPTMFSKSPYMRIIYRMSFHLFYLNNAANPFIYTMINKSFRQECSTVLRNIGRSWRRQTL